VHKARQLRYENARLKRLVADLTLDRHILPTRKGWQFGHSRVHRLYKLEGLQVRLRVRRRKRISLHRGPVPAATGGGQYWAVDFVHDQLANGRKSRVLTEFDKWHRQCVALQADFALTGYSVVDAMNAIARERDFPYAITVDHGTEFTSKVLDHWRYLRGVKLDFIWPGKPIENAFIESFDGRLRDECPNVNEFATLDEARLRLQSWQQDYNNHRPRGSLGRMTPSEFAAKGQKSDSEAPKL
jgi:putative transposase